MTNVPCLGSTSNRQKSRRRKEKQRPRNESREKMMNKSFEGRPKSAIVDVVTIDEELIEKNRLEKEIAGIIDTLISIFAYFLQL